MQPCSTTISYLGPTNIWGDSTRLLTAAETCSRMVLATLNFQTLKGSNSAARRHNAPMQFRLCTNWASCYRLSMDTTRSAIKDIEGTDDLLEKSLKLAGLVTRLFADAGCNLVIVGGSAVELYTEGAYMSGDIDFCRRELTRIPLRQAQDIMATLGATGGPRSWQVAGLYVDLLGFLENESVAPCRTIATPFGTVSVLPPETTLVERVLLAFYPQPDPNAREVARKLLAACLSGVTPVDWDEVSRLAALPDFNVTSELDELRQEVQRELNR